MQPGLVLTSGAAAMQSEDHNLWIGKVSYTASIKQWLQRSGHYLQNAPPGCLFAVAVYQAEPGLFDTLQPRGPLQGLCLVSRPVARKLPQDGSFGEVTRLYLVPGLPHGTASSVLRHAAAVGKARRMQCLISYHDRTRHSGCIYRKAGFKKWGLVNNTGAGWEYRGRKSSAVTEQVKPKRRWKLDL